jgi:hypothetical protein
MVHRHIPADQKAAILLQAAESYPEVKEALEGIKEENTKRRKGGKPLGAGVPRGNTAELIGKLAGVGGTTVKQVQRVKREAPEQFEEVARGRTTAKKALKGLKGKRAKAKKPGPKGDPTGAAEKADGCLTGTVRLRISGSPIEKVLAALQQGEAQVAVKGAAVWLNDSQAAALVPGDPLPEGCLSEVVELHWEGFQRSELNTGNDLPRE